MDDSGGKLILPMRWQTWGQVFGFCFLFLNDVKPEVRPQTAPYWRIKIQIENSQSLWLEELQDSVWGQPPLLGGKEWTPEWERPGERESQILHINSAYMFAEPWTTGDLVKTPSSLIKDERTELRVELLP